MRIQHNIMAMSAYRNYTNNVSAMKKNLEKLSSGYKINRAGDDAAGLAISEKMRAQITGLETAQKNAKDGISLVQTAEGALTEVHDMLNRMVELATQSANGTYDNTTDRAQMQKEVDQLRSEINRIADSSNFNGINLLDGSMESKIAVDGQTDLYESGVVEVVSDGQLGNTPQAGVYQLDLSGFEGEVTGTGGVKLSLFGKTITLNSGDYAKNGTAIGGENGKISVEKFAEDIAKEFNKDNDFTGKYGVYLVAEGSGDKVTFTMRENKTAAAEEKAPTALWDQAVATDDNNIFTSGLNINYGKASADVATTPGGVANQAQGMRLSTVKEAVDSSMGRKYAEAKIDVSALDIKDGSALTIGDTTYTFAVGRDSKYKSSENVIDLTDMTVDTVLDNSAKIANRITTAALGNKNFKVTASTALGGNGNGYIYITEKEGGVDTDDYKLEGEANVNADGTTGITDDGDWTGLVKFGTVNPNANKGLTLQIGDTADVFNQLKVSIKDMHTDSMGIGEISIADQDSAAKAVDAIKAAINYVSDVRGTLGATQNRLDHTINNLSVMTENIQDAESTIRDTDVADEMMAYTKNNILIQSAQAMLAQANQVPQGVLQLLQ